MSHPNEKVLTASVHITETLVSARNLARDLYGEAYRERCAPYERVLRIAMEKAGDTPFPFLALARILADGEGCLTTSDEILFASAAIEIVLDSVRERRNSSHDRQVPKQEL
jgi:hypothetical protein